MGELTLTVFTGYDRDGPVVEIWNGAEQWGEVAFEEASKRFSLTVYSARSGSAFIIDLHVMQQVLAEAEARLRDRGYIPL